VDQLRSCCPPAEPGDLPDGAEAILQWFTDEYLPYRLWESQHREKPTGRMAELAQAFEQWLLAFYPEALAGANRDCLALSRRPKLKSEDRAILWVMLDGLGFWDAQHLVKLLAGCARLSLVRLSPLIGCIPTITEFAQPALLAGVPPDLAANQDISQGGLLQELPTGNQSLKPLLSQAQPGHGFLLKLKEPDATYHQPGDKGVVYDTVRSQLHAISERIGKAIALVPDDVPLTVIVSTDHGRLLSRATRDTAVPDQMQAHGRAAWGKAGKEFPSSGVVRDGEVVYLSGQRFDMPCDCAIVSGEGVFRTVDGRTGPTNFPHGGLFPEEVIVPWIEFERDGAPPQLSVHLEGKAQAGTQGQVMITASNASALAVRIDLVRLRLAGCQPTAFPCELLVRPSSRAMGEVTLGRWPSGNELAGISAECDVVLPNGRSFVVQATANLDATEMYRRDLRLEEL